MKNTLPSRFALFLLLNAMTVVAAQSPFQFREAYFLERRIKDAGKDYQTGHPQHLFHTGPDLANQYVVDSRAIETYQDYQKMIPVIRSIDEVRSSGGIKVAEQRYLEVIEMIRKAQGPDSGDEALVLDHLGEFYLEQRNFDRAYQVFSDALRVRRIAVERARHDPNDARRVDPQFGVGRVHLADILTRLGQLDLARGDLATASAKLAEAIEINNKPAYLIYENRLDPIYFQSLVLEKQGKWQEAEALWQDAISRREKIGNEPYWDAKKELAAVFARQGDFRSAAKVASEILIRTANQNFNRALGNFYWLDSRHSADTWGFYENESNHAMQEILTIDRWISEGPEAAARLMSNPIDTFNVFFLENGSQADLLRLYNWIEKKTFLQMSILLDGSPTPERAARAYEVLGAIKGRYVSLLAELGRRMDEMILNPGISGDFVHFPEELAETRERYTNAYLSLVLGDKPISSQEFADRASEEQAITEAAIATCFNNCLYGSPGPSLASNVPSGSVLVDFILWDRFDRQNLAHKIPEYGAFVLTSGRPVRYIRIGDRSQIDEAIRRLQIQVDGFFQSTHIDKPEEVQHALQDLYAKVLAPLEGTLQGATRIMAIPDGQLSLVPLGALIDRQGRYFLEQHTVSYLTSWRQLQGTRRAAENGTTSPPLILANPDFDLVLPGSASASPRTSLVFHPLPGSETEAHEVGKVLHLSESRILTGKSAREELLHSIRGPEILHLATHSDPFVRARAPEGQISKYDLFEFPSLVMAQDPFLRSVIAFAGANRPQAGPEDGLLTGMEVASLHLAGTKLVVLSSCQSANGRLVEGQGIPGLRAAFSAAGARSLLMNLWPVDDEAGPSFMQVFYSRLDLGAAEAARQAQLHLMTKTKYKNPLYWAGYTYSDNAPFIKDSSGAMVRAPAKAGTTNTQGGDGLLITPRCFQFSGSGKENGDFKTGFTARLALGGVVRKLQSTEHSAVYDIHLPGNEAAVVFDLNGTQMSGGMFSSRADGTTLTVLRTANSSSLSVRLPGTSQDLISLKGPAGLFPTLEIPEVLPPVSSYTEALVMGDKIDSIGFCGPGPLIQYNDGKVGIPPPAPSTLATAPSKPPAPLVQKAEVSKQVLLHVLQGDRQYVADRLAPEADRKISDAMFARLSSMQHCGGAVEVHKVSWRDTPPGYVALSNCGARKARLWLIINDQGLISRIGYGFFISSQSKEQVEQKAKSLVTSLTRNDIVEFRNNFTDGLRVRDSQERISSELNTVTENLGSLKEIFGLQKDPYSDIVVIDCQYERGHISIELDLDPDLKIRDWHIQPSGSPRRFPQEFRDIP